MAIQSVQILAGYRCCSLMADSSEENPVYECDTSYADSWELLWYGPVALLAWVYAIAAIHFYKLYRHAFMQTKIRQLSGLNDTLEDIKQDIVNRIVSVSKRITGVSDVDDLIALSEDCGFLDILGVDKARQSKITNTLNIVVTFLIFSTYYIFYGVFLYEYKQQVCMQTVSN